MHVTVITCYAMSIWRIAKGEPRRAGRPFQARGQAWALGGWAPPAWGRGGAAQGRHGAMPKGQNLVAQGPQNVIIQ